MISRSQLERLAALAPPDTPTQRHIAHGNFDIESFMHQHLTDNIRSTSPWNGGRKWLLHVCPFDPEHTDRSAVVIEMPSGALVFRCMHNGCANRRWDDLRALYEPKIIQMPHAGRTSAPIVEKPAMEDETEPEVSDRFALTDMGNGKRFAHWHGEDCRYCDPQQKWYVYDETRFAADTTQEVQRRAKDAVLRIYIEARNEPNEAHRQELGKHAVRSESVPRLKAMLTAAESELPITTEQMDCDHFLFNVMNGTVDLRTGELRPHSREDLLTKRSPVFFISGAECPLWLKTLSRAMEGSEEKIAYLQRLFGYCMTGDTREHVLAFFYGLGRNGKTLITLVISFILGDYAIAVQPETIMRRDRKDQSNDIAMLFGARFVVTPEVEDGTRMAESLVKQITGGDRVTARHLYHEYFTFTPTFKIVITGNHKPIVRGDDPAIWERIHLVPFTVVIPPDERDPQLAEKLKAESSGILNWMIEGCLQWQRSGLAPPAEIVGATEEYRGEMDVLGHFFEECCVVGPAFSAGAGDLYHAYASWCTDRGERSVSQTRFGLALGQRGLRKDLDSSTRRVLWRGVGLRADETDISKGSKGFEGVLPDFSHMQDKKEKGGNGGITPSTPSGEVILPDVDRREEEGKSF